MYVYEHPIEGVSLNLYEIVRAGTRYDAASHTGYPELEEKPNALSLEDGVTLARDGFEARAVEDDYSFVSVVDQSCAL
jgi:hypothetical protein